MKVPDILYFDFKVRGIDNDFQFELFEVNQAK